MLPSPLPVVLLPPHIVEMPAKNLSVILRRKSYSSLVITVKAIERTRKGDHDLYRADACPVKAETYRVAERYGRLANSGATPQIDVLLPWAYSAPKKQAAAWKGRLSNVMLLY